MIDYLFHNWRKLSKQSPAQGLDKLIPVLFQNGFDPQNVVNRKLKVFCHAKEPCKRPSLVKKKQRVVQSQKYKVDDLLKENHRRFFFTKEDGTRKEKELIIDSYTRIQIDKRR